MPILSSKSGYSLIELMVVIIIISIIATVSVKSLKTASDTARTERTKKEMDQLAFAVAGNPGLASGGTRTDFGYVGDVGSLPPNLDALVTNSGGYATWNGPYLKDDYVSVVGGSNSEFKIDDWGVSYGYSAGVTITSTGSGQTFTRQIANSVNDLLYNSVAVVVTDVNHVPPGLANVDSVKVVLTYPNGTGATFAKTKNPAADGFVQIDSVPIGLHTLRVIYIPQNDTLIRKVAINPGDLAAIDVQLFRDIWSSSGAGGGTIEYVNGTIGFDGGDCEEVTFDITNTSGSNITLTDMTVSWSTPNTWYDEIKFNGNKIWDQNSPSNATGDVATFSSPQVISAGQTISVVIKDFEDQNDGNGNDVDMNNVTFTITFSDGSTFNVTTPGCP